MFVLHLVFYLECARTAGRDLWLGSLQESCKGKRLIILNKEQRRVKKELSETGNTVKEVAVKAHKVLITLHNVVI